MMKSESIIAFSNCYLSLLPVGCDPNTYHTVHYFIRKLPAKAQTSHAIQMYKHLLMFIPAVNNTKQLAMSTKCKSTSA